MEAFHQADNGPRLKSFHATLCPPGTVKNGLPVIYDKKKGPSRGLDIAEQDLAEIETVQGHDLGPGFHEVLDEHLVRAFVGIDLSYRSQLRV